MPYVRRTPEGLIESLHRVDDGAGEFIDADHPEVLAFLGTESTATGRFAELDADFVRVIEDVIDTLIQRNVINITDLPAEAQTKLFSRKSFRERSSRQSLRLFGDADLQDLLKK